ncbi:hypothetical protein Ciccas_011567 [Cichlidogyrus casuarinus]|uniref:Uncharacterized protein n=1 Tax=Cichlidogyrus casuarinus TaxID=1844966 RepID=A0ABD2PRJ0_9PLAT
MSCKWQELKNREVHPEGKNISESSAMLMSTQINYVDAFVKIVRDYVQLEPICVFRKITDLPKKQRSFYLPTGPLFKDGLIAIFHDRELINDLQLAPWITTAAPKTCVPCQDSLDGVNQLLACDLLIGDIFIAQCLAESKEQARTCLAKMGFCNISTCCYLVGAIRTWEHTDFLSVCLSSKPTLVPKLPPFLFDPVESGDRFTEKLGDFRSPTFNSKPYHELWLYTADLDPNLWDSQISYERMLAQSLEFSQMKVTYEIEVDPLQRCFCAFACLDGQRVSLAFATNAVAARAQASCNLFFKLKQTQPIVGLHPYLREKTFTGQFCSHSELKIGIII